MVPDAGYWISATQAITLTYPTAVITPTTSISQTNRLAQIRAAEQTAGVRPTYQWMNFYGQAALADGAEVITGTVVLALDPQDTICGATVVTHAGNFGLLACYGDNQTTPYDEGGQAGDTIRLVLSSDGVHADGQLVGAGDWTTPGDRQEAVPPQELQPPQVFSAPAWQQVQYQSAITETIYTATDNDTFGAAIAATIFWSVDAGPWQAGLPLGMSLSEKACTDAGAGTSCEWRLNGQADVPAGAYSVEMRVSDGVNTVTAQSVIVVNEAATGLLGIQLTVALTTLILLTWSQGSPTAPGSGEPRRRSNSLPVAGPTSGRRWGKWGTAGRSGIPKRPGWWRGRFLRID